MSSGRDSTPPSRAERDSEPGSGRAPRGVRRSISFLAAAGWVVGTGLVIALLLQMAESMRPGADGDIVTFTGCCVVTYMLVVFGMLRVYEPETSIREALGLRATSPLAPILAAIAGAGVYPTLSALDDLVSRSFPARTDEETELVTKLFTTHGFGSRAFLFVACALLMPLAEQSLFCGTLYGGLKRGRARMEAILATVGCYAFLHDVRALGSMVTIGLLIAWLRAESGSILPSCAAHIAWSVVPTARFLQTSSFDEHFPRSWTIGGAAAAIASFAGLFALLRRDARAAAGRDADA